jgi:hypothetical protein
MKNFGNIWRKILGKIWSCVENNSGSPGKSIQVKLSASVIYFKYVKLFPQGEIVKMLLCERFTLINLVQWLNIRTDNDYPCLIAIGQDNICRHTNKFITI